jgi:hypothetical protein
MTKSLVAADTSHVARGLIWCEGAWSVIALAAAIRIGKAKGELRGLVLFFAVEALPPIGRDLLTRETFSREGELAHEGNLFCCDLLSGFWVCGHSTTQSNEK